jgi:hypothetical protein
MRSSVRSRAFLGYAVGGACSTTSFYAFMSASPFIFENLLHRPTQEVGLYYIFLMGGVGAGSFLANRLSRIVGLREGLRIANFVTIAGAVLFVLFDVFDVLSGPTVTGAVTLFMVGAGMASPFALAPRHPQHPGQHALLRVQPVLRLVEHHRLRSVDDLLGHFLAAMRRQAVHEDRVRRGLRHQFAGDRYGASMLCRFEFGSSDIDTHVSVTTQRAP